MFWPLTPLHSDAIPTHLLTIEAFQQYAPPQNGVLAVHISNRHLTCSQLLPQQAKRYRCHYVLSVLTRQELKAAAGIDKPR